MVIVGGGIAGLAASIYLARGGRTVTLFEKRRYLGGRNRIKELSQVCAQGLWFHRLWWSMTGQA